MKKVLSTILFGLIFAFALPLQSLANDWVTDQKDFSRNAIVSGVTPPAELSVRWIKTTPLNNFQMPVYSEGILYFSEEAYYNSPVSEHKFAVYAVKKSTGEELWRKTGAGVLRNSPAVVGDTIIIPAPTLFALNSKTGEEIWSKAPTATDAYYLSPVIKGDKLIIFDRQSYYHGFLTSLNLADGSVNWNLRLVTYGPPNLSLYKDNVIFTNATYNNYTVIRSFGISDGTLNWTYTSDYNPKGGVVVDEAAGLGVLSFVVINVSVLNLDNGTHPTGFAVGSLPSRPVLQNGKAYFVTYQNYDTFFNVCDYINGGCSVHKKLADGLLYEQRTTPVVVGDKFYFGGSGGKFYEVNTGDGVTKSYTIADAATYLTYTFYADGMFLASDYYLKKLYSLGLGLEPITASSTVELTSPYETDGEYHPYLGQLHCHYIPDFVTPFNDASTPATTEERYRDAGYDFVALTEHNIIEPDPGVGGILHIANSEEDTQGHGGNHILAIGINSPIDETMSDQDRINSVTNQGGVPILAHPNSEQYSWSLKSLFDLSSYSNIEVKNGGMSWLDPTKFAGNSFSADKWDSLLLSRKKIFGTAGDDYTPGDPGFDGGAVLVLSKTSSQSDILSNLKSGNFYALQGSGAPRINVSTSGDTVSVSSDRQSTIRFISQGKVIKEVTDSSLASYSTVGTEVYVRAEVESSGKKAWSQPVFVTPKQFVKTPFAGGYNINFVGGSLTSKNTSSVGVNTLSNSEYPANSPQLGYMSNIYSLTSETAPEAGTELSLSYDGKKVLTNEDNLSIYSLIDGSWQKVPSTIDKVKKTVSALLSHFSLYTLSAEEPEDLEKPVVTLSNPTDLSNLSGIAQLSADATDNNAVITTSFYIDDKLIGEDSDGTDGWRSTLDTNSLANGEHKIKVTAEDLSANIGEAEYSFTLNSSTFVPPAILSFEADGSAENSGADLWDPTTITGRFSSNLSVSSISILLDGYVVTNADINGNNFSKEIAWSNFKEGEHILKAVLVDENGNTAEVTRNINISDTPKVTIISPDKDSYLESEKIKFSHSLPAGQAGSNNTAVVAKLDGNVIENNLEKFGYEIGLGEHLFVLAYKGQVIAEKGFVVTTTFADLSNLVNTFYAQGEISNYGISMAIDSRLETAENMDSAGKENLSDTILGILLKFIEIQNSVDHVSDFARDILVDSLNYLLSN